MSQVSGVAAVAVELAPMRWWHIPACAALDRELFGDEAWTPELLWSELANPLTYYLIVRRPGSDAPIGYAGLAWSETESYVQTIGVAKDAQRAGLGRLLMDALLAEARRRGAAVCWLEVRADNVAAQALYRRLGFTVSGVRRGYYQPSGMDALVMGLDLA